MHLFKVAVLHLAYSHVLWTRRVQGQGHGNFNKSTSLFDTVLTATKHQLKQEISERLQSESYLWALVRGLGSRLLAFEGIYPMSSNGEQPSNFVGLKLFLLAGGTGGTGIGPTVPGGTPGTPGLSGKDGLTGVTGPRGATGLGLTSSMGAQGYTGDQGPPGGV